MYLPFSADRESSSNREMDGSQESLPLLYSAEVADRHGHKTLAFMTDRIVIVEVFSTIFESSNCETHSCSPGDGEVHFQYTDATSEGVESNESWILRSRAKQSFVGKIVRDNI